MFESDRKLRHLPYFEFVASRAETDPQWQRAAAGLLVLRLVDSWAEDGRPSLTDDSWAVANVRSQIELVDRGTPIRSLLFRVVDALQAGPTSTPRVFTPLMAYAQALEYDAQWQLAADVYHTVLAHADPATEAETSIAGHLGLGRCYRYLNNLSDAAVALKGASDVAASAGDMEGVLRARIGLAKLDITRGNLPRAEQILDETITRAQGPTLSDVRSQALHEKANIAHRREQYELAIQLAYQALAQSQVARERDRILGDIALAFMELGVYSAARDAYMVLSATAQEQFVRWASTLNLLEISAKTGAETLFELYRRQLVTQDLPPHMATALQLSSGMAYRQFGDWDKARTHLQCALAMAGEYGFNQMLFEAEEALYQLEIPMAPPGNPASISLDTQEVASAVQRLRETVGAD